MKFQKKYLVTTLLLLGSAGLVACSGNGENSGETAVEEKVVKVWGLDGAETEVYNQLLPKIDEAYDEFTIDFSFYPKDEFYNKLQLAPQVGDTPDIVIMDATQVPYYVQADMLQTVDDLYTEEMKNDMLDSIIRENTIDGNLYGVAQFDSGMAMWANKKMLEEANVRIPKDANDAWTRKEFEDALVKLKESGIEYPLYLRQNSPTTLLYTYFPIVKSFGGELLNDETGLTDTAMNNPKTIEAYEYISWLISEEYVNPYVDYEDGFSTRTENALSLVGHWAFKDYTDALGDDAILIPLPDFGNGVYTGSGSVVWNLTKQAEENGVTNEAKKILTEVISEENIKDMVTVNGGVPSRISVLDQDENFKEGGKKYLYRQQLEEGLGVIRPQTPGYNTLYNDLRDATANIFNGSNAKEELEAASKKTDDVLKENGWTK